MRDVEWTLPYVGFLIYIFVIVTFKLGIASVGVAMALVGVMFQREKLRFPAFIGWMCALLGWVVLSYVQTEYRDLVTEAMINQMKLVLIAFAGVNALRSRAQIRFLMVFFVACYMLVPARTAFVNYAAGHTLFGRAVGSFIYQNPNDLAALTILAFAIAAALAFSEPAKSLMKLGAIVSAAALLLLILMTQSRGAVLGVAAMTAPYWLFLLRKKPRAFFGALALTIALAMAAPGGVWQRLAGLRNATQLETISEVDPEGSGAERFEILQTAARIVADHPLFGVGWGAYAQANGRYNPDMGPRDTHNTYANIAAELGIPGLLIFLALVAGLLRRARAVGKMAVPLFPEQAQLLKWLELGLIGYLTAGIFGSFAKLTFLYVFMTLLWCSAEVLRSQVATSPIRRGRGSSLVPGRR